MELSLPLRLPHARPRGSRPRLGDLAPAILRGRPRAVRGALCLALALPSLGGAWLWLRDSPLVAVREVRVAGVRGPEAIAIRDALERAATGMTTMRFSVAALRAAVSGYPIVASIQARTSFPHGVSIQVRERVPVAVLVAPGERSALAADGTALGPGLASAALPTIAVKGVPAPGRPVAEAAPLAAATLLGAAPPALLRYVARVYEGTEGMTAQMRDGLLVYFGAASLPHAKWLSLARVLGSPTAAGAVYVDVRLPSRPAAGFAFTPPARASATSASRIGGADPAAAALAERLAQSTGAGSSAGTTAAAAEPQSGGGGATAGSAAESEQAPAAGAAGSGSEGNAESAPAAGAQAPSEGSTSG